MSYDPQANLRHWPLEPMARFGQNPFGENIWRIVHAPSRRSLVHGKGHKPQWITTYPQASNAWVLEKWLSAYEFTKCTPEIWNMSMTLLGPYPSRGEYELAHTFDPVPAADCNIEKLISWIKAGTERHSLAENYASIKEDARREDNDARNYRDSVIRNALPAFGAAAMSGYKGGRGTKTFDFPLRAPANGPSPGRVRSAPGTKRYDVSHLITA